MHPTTSLQTVRCNALSNTKELDNPFLPDSNRIMLPRKSIRLYRIFFLIVIATTSCLPIYGQTEKPLSEFEQHRQKAGVLYEKKDLKNYLSELETLLKIASTKESDHPHVASTYNNLGVIYESKGDYDKAIEYYTKSLPILLRTFGGEHPYVAASYYNLGAVYKSKKDFPKVIEYLQKAIHIYEKSEERDNYILAYTRLKEVYIEQKQTDMAINALKQAMELVLKFRQTMGQDKTDFTQRHLSVFKELIRLYQETNQPEKAFEVSEKMRGLSMMEDFQKHLALNQSRIPKDKSDEFLTLQKNLESLYSQKTALLRNSKTPQLAIDNIKNTISERERTLAAMENEFEKKYPEYATLKKIQFPSISELKNQLKKKDATIVEYVLATNKERKGIPSCVCH
jgi:tetratricopeptide (TPR) repeat protein